MKRESLWHCGNRFCNWRCLLQHPCRLLIWEGERRLCFFALKRLPLINANNFTEQDLAYLGVILQYSAYMSCLIWFALTIAMADLIAIYCILLLQRCLNLGCETTVLLQSISPTGIWLSCWILTTMAMLKSAKTNLVFEWLWMCLNDFECVWPCDFAWLAVPEWNNNGPCHFDPFGNDWRTSKSCERGNCMKVQWRWNMMECCKTIKTLFRKRLELKLHHGQAIQLQHFPTPHELCSIVQSATVLRVGVVWCCLQMNSPPISHLYAHFIRMQLRFHSVAVCGSNSSTRFHKTATCAVEPDRASFRWLGILEAAHSSFKLWWLEWWVVAWSCNHGSIIIKQTLRYWCCVTEINKGTSRSLDSIPEKSWKALPCPSLHRSPTLALLDCGIDSSATDNATKPEEEVKESDAEICWRVWCYHSALQGQASWTGHRSFDQCFEPSYGWRAKEEEGFKKEQQEGARGHRRRRMLIASDCVEAAKVTKSSK